MTNGVLQTLVRMSDARSKRDFDDKIFEIWRKNTDRSTGELIHTVRSMYWLPTGSVARLGDPLYARGPVPRLQLVYHIDLR